MAEWRPYGASNQPDTCVWCGNKLRHKIKDWHEERTQIPIPEEQQWDPDVTTRTHVRNVTDRRAEKGGDYEDGLFCGLRCGYMFGVRMGELGRRLAPKT